MKGPDREARDSQVTRELPSQEQLDTRFEDSEATDRGSLTAPRVIPASLSFVQGREPVTVGVRLIGNLNRNALRAALEGVISRHRILQPTRPGDQDTAPGVTDQAECLSFVEQKVFHDTDVEQIRREEALRPLGQSGGPAIRARLTHHTEQDSVLLITLRESVADDWSAGIFIDEFCQLYCAFVDGRGDTLPPPKYQYADY